MVNVIGPRIARFVINPMGSSSGIMIRDVMFLDELDVLVVGNIEGIFPLIFRSNSSRPFECRWICCAYSVQ